MNPKIPPVISPRVTEATQNPEISTATAPVTAGTTQAVTAFPFSLETLPPLAAQPPFRQRPLPAVGQTTPLLPQAALVSPVSLPDFLSSPLESQASHLPVADEKLSKNAKRKEKRYQTAQAEQNQTQSANPASSRVVQPAQHLAQIAQHSPQVMAYNYEQTLLFYMKDYLNRIALTQPSRFIAFLDKPDPWVVDHEARWQTSGQEEKHAICLEIIQDRENVGEVYSPLSGAADFFAKNARLFDRRVAQMKFSPLPVGSPKIWFDQAAQMVLAEMTEALSLPNNLQLSFYDKKMVCAFKSLYDLLAFFDDGSRVHVLEGDYGLIESFEERWINESSPTPVNQVDQINFLLGELFWMKHHLHAPAFLESIITDSNRQYFGDLSGPKPSIQSFKLDTLQGSPILWAGAAQKLSDRARPDIARRVIAAIDALEESTALLRSEKKLPSIDSGTITTQTTTKTAEPMTKATTVTTATTAVTAGVQRTLLPATSKQTVVSPNKTPTKNMPNNVAAAVAVPDMLSDIQPDGPNTPKLSSVLAALQKRVNLLVFAQYLGLSEIATQTPLPPDLPNLADLDANDIKAAQKRISTSNADWNKTIKEAIATNHGLTEMQKEWMQQRLASLHHDTLKISEDNLQQAVVKLSTQIRNGLDREMNYLKIEPDSELLPASSLSTPSLETPSADYPMRPLETLNADVQQILAEFPLKNIRADMVIELLKADGWQEKGTARGSHHRYVKTSADGGEYGTTVAYHNLRDAIPHGTLSQILQSTGLKTAWQTARKETET